MASTGETWRLGHRPALDGLRGVAVLLVVVEHLQLPIIEKAGTIGVTMFFTLSGFLITALLLEERLNRGTVSLRSFYRRRAVRLLPALAVFLTVMVGVGLAAPRTAVVAALYFGNWVVAFGGHLGPLNHTWSLAVEEQFYILWPMVAIVVLSRRRLGARALLLIAVAGAISSVVARLVMWDGGAGGNRIYNGSDTRADALLIGCALAIALHNRRPATRNSAVLATAAVFASLTFVPSDGWVSFVLLPTVIALLTAVTIGALAAGPEWDKSWFSTRWIVVVGQRSYGLYLWHFPLLWILLPMLDMPRLISAPLLIATAWGLTCLSWRFVEQPAKRWAAGQPSRVQEATTA